MGLVSTHTIHSRSSVQYESSSTAEEEDVLEEEGHFFGHWAAAPFGWQALAKPWTLVPLCMVVPPTLLVQQPLKEAQIFEDTRTTT